MSAPPLVSTDEERLSGSPAWLKRLTPDERYVLDTIVAPAAPRERRGQWVNEGYRFFCLGETESGKTSLMRLILYGTLGLGYARFALIHDTKGVLPEYPRSLLFPHVDHFRVRGFRDGDIPVASFRGAPRFNVECSAEEVGSLSKELAQKGRELPGGEWTTCPHVLVVEELAEAATDGRKHLRAPSVLWGLERGRTLGESVIGTTQSPRKLPLDFFGQATSIAFFRLTGADANYLDRAEFDPALVAAVRGENNVGLPNHHFAIYVKGKPWDGKIYCLSEKTALMFE